MKPEGSLPHTQEPVICSRPEPDQSSPRPTPSYFRKIHFNIIVPLQVRRCLVHFLSFYGEFLALRPTTKLENHPLSAVRYFLFDMFTATLHIWWPFLHPQPEDVSCRGDRDPLITVTGTHLSVSGTHLSVTGTHVSL